MGAQSSNIKNNHITVKKRGNNGNREHDLQKQYTNNKN